MCRRAILILTLWAPLSVGAQELNPYDGDPGAIRFGAALFRHHCSACHGGDAKGVTAPDLTALWVSGSTDERVFRIIRWGVPQSAMPPNALPDDQVWAITAYLKGLGGAPEWPAGTGDPERGRSLFADECSGCHRLDGRGGWLGPELSNIAATRAREAVVQSIRTPSASIDAAYRAATLVTPDGERVRGIVKNEDAFSIQLIDEAQRLQGYRKAELRALEHEQVSLMPELTPAELSDAALEDLLEYLRQQTAELRAASVRDP